MRVAQWPAVLITSGFVLGCGPAPTPSVTPPAGTPAAPSVNYMQVADRLVNSALGVKPGDNVLLTGTPTDIELLEDLSVAVRKAGGWPMISINSSREARLSYDSIPAARDGDTTSLNLGIAKLFRSSINVAGANDPGVFKDISPERIAGRANAAAVHADELNKIVTKAVNIGNGLFPSAALAKQFDMTEAALSELFWNGVNVDPATMAATGNAVRSALKVGKKVEVTGPGGTNFSFMLAGNDPYFSDGAITDDDMKRGQAGGFVWLPSGEVYVRVAPGTAEGTVVVPSLPFEGGYVTDLRVDVAGGKITGMTGGGAFARWRSQYDNASGGKERFSIVDVGVNPNVAIPAGSKLVTWVAAGNVTLVFGNDAWAGGSNNATGGLSAFLSGMTVTVDGKAIVMDGKLQTM